MQIKLQSAVFEKARGFLTGFFEKEVLVVWPCPCQSSCIHVGKYQQGALTDFDFDSTLLLVDYSKSSPFSAFALVNGEFQNIPVLVSSASANIHNIHDFNSLNLSLDSCMTSYISSIMDLTDEYAQDQWKYQGYARALLKEQKNKKSVSVEPSKAESLRILNQIDLFLGVLENAFEDTSDRVDCAKVLLH